MLLFNYYCTLAFVSLNISFLFVSIQLTENFFAILPNMTASSKSMSNWPSN
jgi:hypothetical protein